MKYIEYISILLFTLFRKVFGLVWIYVALPFRKYARNTVYNYVLANGVYLQRLLERPIWGIGKESDHYIIHPYHGTTGGYIKKRKVSWIEYKLVYWLIWGWLDDDSNEDTYAYGHCERLRKEGAIWRWMFKGLEQPQYGNSFDLGDAREPAFHFWATTVWTWRNTAMNFGYMQRVRQDQPFLFKIGKYKFGWELDDTFQGNPVYEIRFMTWE